MTSESNIAEDADPALQEQQRFLKDFVDDLEVQGFLEPFIRSYKYDQSQTAGREPTSQAITIAVLGKTGSGKSSTCNTVIGINNKFQTGQGQSSVTMETRMEEARVQIDGTQNNDYIVKVIDTPGFFDINPYSDQLITSLQNEINQLENAGDLGELYLHQKRRIIELEKDQQKKRQEKIEGDIKKFLEVAPGINAFFVVISLDERLGPETPKMLRILLNLFGGKHFKNRAFLILSHLDKIKVTEKEYVHQDMFHPFIKEFLQQIDHRCIFVNNELVKRADTKEETYRWRRSCFKKILDNLKEQNIQPYGVWHSQIPQLSRQQIILDMKMNNFIQKRAVVEDEIIQLQETYMNHRKNTMIASGVGAGASILVGTPLTVAGLILAVPTLGVSTILAIAGAAISVSGGLTAGGAAIAEAYEKRKAKSEIDVHVKEFTEAVIEFQQVYNNVEEIFLNVVRNFCSEIAEDDAGVDCDKSRNINLFIATTFVQTILSGGRVAFHITAGLSGDFLKLIGIVGMKAVPIIGVVLGTLLDLATLMNAVNRSKNAAKCYEEFQLKFKECKNNFAEFSIHVENLKSMIITFCKDPYRFMKNLFASLETYYTCGICHDFCIDIQPCVIDKKHTAGCVQCLRDWHSDQLERKQIPTCPVCTEFWIEELE